MINDPIVDELHQQRAKVMERFNYDFDAYCRYLKEQEKLSTEPVVSPPASSPNTVVQQARVARR